MDALWHEYLARVPAQRRADSLAALEQRRLTPRRAARTLSADALGDSDPD